MASLVGDLTQSGRQVPTHVHGTCRGLSRPWPPSCPGASAGDGVGGRRRGQAVGAFLVENRLLQRVSTPVVASTFVGPAGEEVRPHLSLDPEIVTLEPGEQVLVRVIGLIDDQLEPGVTYRGSVSVPGLGGSNVRLVLRRRVAPA